MVEQETSDNQPAEAPAERQETRQQARKHKASKRAHKARHEPTRPVEESGLETFSPAFLRTVIVIMAIALIGLSYWVGYEVGQLGEGSPAASPGAANQPPAAAAPPAAPPAAAPPPPVVPKSAKPTVELFIMSYCPFGLQAQKAFVQVEELLGDEADMEVKFVNYIMHDFKEVEDNTREYCIQTEQPAKWIAFEKCFVETTDYAQCAQKAGVDTAKVESCYAAADAEFGIQAAWDDKASWLSGRYAKYPLQDADNLQYGVQGSPTLVINGEEVSVARSAEAFKQAVCAAFTTAPADCQKTLNNNQEQPGPGPIGAGTSPAAAAAGNCG